jgi:hypothetical protein
LTLIGPSPSLSGDQSTLIRRELRIETVKEPTAPSRFEKWYDLIPKIR